MRQIIVKTTRVGSILLLLAALISQVGCGKSPATSSSSNGRGKTFQGEHPIQVTVTVGMVGDLVRRIGGEHLQVKQLMGSGVDPHLYTPTRDDTSAVLSADIIFYNGLMLEGKMGAVLNSGQGDRLAIAVAEGIPTKLLGKDPAESSHPDPHVWMDVSLWSEAAQVVGDALASFDPEHQSDYAMATQTLREELASLHEYGKEVIACVPKEQRILVTSHDAFRYFGSAYDIEVQAVQGISTDSEPSVARTIELVDMLVSKNIKSVFTESSVPEEFLMSLLDGAQDRGHAVANADSLFSDAMGKDGKYTGTYIGMMDHNFSTIARALGCDSVPEDGFRGWRSDEQ